RGRRRPVPSARFRRATPALHRGPRRHGSGGDRRVVVRGPFACRSETRAVGRWSLHDNRLLLGAVACELALLVAFLALPPVAHVLGHAAPTALGWALAALVVPAVLLV